MLLGKLSSQVLVGLEQPEDLVWRTPRFPTGASVSARLSLIAGITPAGYKVTLSLWSVSLAGEVAAGNDADTAHTNPQPVSHRLWIRVYGFGVYSLSQTESGPRVFFLQGISSVQLFCVFSVGLFCLMYRMSSS